MAAATALSDRLPTQDETKKASAAVTAISKALATSDVLPITITEDGGSVTIDLPPAVGYLILDLLDHIARGNAVTFVPYGAELTTQKAADLLNVSRPHLISLLDEGKILHHRVGSHRRIKAEDLFTYKELRDKDREAAMDELQRLGEEFEGL